MFRLTHLTIRQDFVEKFSALTRRDPHYVLDKEERDIFFSTRHTTQVLNTHPDHAHAAIHHRKGTLASTPVSSAERHMLDSLQYASRLLQRGETEAASFNVLVEQWHRQDFDESPNCAYYARYEILEQSLYADLASGGRHLASIIRDLEQLKTDLKNARDAIAKECNRQIKALPADLIPDEKDLQTKRLRSQARSSQQPLGALGESVEHLHDHAIFRLKKQKCEAFAAAVKAKTVDERTCTEAWTFQRTLFDDLLKVQAQWDQLHEVLQSKKAALNDLSAKWKDYQAANRRPHHSRQLDAEGLAFRNARSELRDDIDGISNILSRICRECEDYHALLDHMDSLMQNYESPTRLCEFVAAYRALALAPSLDHVALENLERDIDSHLDREKIAARIRMRFINVLHDTRALLQPKSS